MTSRPEYIPRDIFTHEGTRRRINFEIKKLIDERYKIGFDDIRDKVLYVTEPNDAVTHKINISDNYPFEGIILNGIKQNNCPSEFIISILTLIRPTNQNILVYSHHKPILVPKDHFMYGVFEEVVKDSGFDIKNYNVYTLDIKGNPHILADGFAPEFINKYASEPTFDFVFMPDCGGLWYTLQEHDFNGFGPIIGLIESVLKIVKTGGKLVISKFIRPGLFEAVLTHFPTSKPLKFNNFNDVILEIVKN